ncbi:DUF4347 domain-containing protein, partial [Okeania sp. SIO3I5]|uniref:DUF4347 domain-containing protein n=1 Tax=Okeania sp. SIO3I5 TaxID=2607805 RepID=UPI0025F97E07
MSKVNIYQSISAKKTLQFINVSSQLESPQQIVFIDSNVEDYEGLANGVLPGTKVVILDPTSDGVQQITRVIKRYPHILSIHIVSHGAPGCLYLGNSQLNINSINNDYSQELENWSVTNLLLYGCRVAAGNVGKEFLERLGEVTSGNVAASATPTGNAALGGDWELEVNLGNVDVIMPFEVGVLKLYHSILPITLVDETFQNAELNTDFLNWIYGTDETSGDPTDVKNPVLTARFVEDAQENGIPGIGAGADSEGNGALRLTAAENRRAGFVIYDEPFRSDAGLTVEFKIYAYGGSGADGISFFLIDGDANPTQAGGYGGSLGYAIRDNDEDGVFPETNPDTEGDGSFSERDRAGLVGGYIGIGFDEFGNFSNPTQGRPEGPGLTPDSIAIRGSEANDYKYIAGTGTIAAGIDDVSGTRASSTINVRIELTKDGLLSVSIDLNNDGDYDDTDEQPTALQNIDIEAKNGTLPGTFKYGFAASTGGSTNFHEVSNLVIQTIEDPPQIDLDSSTPLPDADYSTTFTEGGGAVAIASVNDITDGDGDNMASATITLTNILDGTDESLSLNTSATTVASDNSIIFSYDSATGVLQLTGSATMEIYQDIIDGIVYDNISDTPDTTDRVIEVVVVEDTGDAFESNTATTTISITPTNDPPVVDDISKSGTEDTDISFSATDFTGKYTDPESDPLTKIQITSLPTDGTLLLNGVAVT